MTALPDLLDTDWRVPVMRDVIGRLTAERDAAIAERDRLKDRLAMTHGNLCRAASKLSRAERALIALREGDDLEHIPAFSSLELVRANRLIADLFADPDTAAVGNRMLALIGQLCDAVEGR